MNHVRRNDKLGNLLRILTESVQLQSGIGDSILATKIEWNKWVEKTWLSNLQEGLLSIDGSIETNFVTPKPQRKFDRPIMEVFASWNIKKKEMKAINRCRIYLQVIYVSDITKYDGRTIVQDALEVQQFRRSTLQWSRQIRPIKADRNTWNKYISKLCFNGNELITTLGMWINPSHQTWKYMESTDGLYLLRYEDNIQKKIHTIGNNKYVKEGTIVTEWMQGYPVKCVITPIGYKIVNEAFKYESVRIPKNILIPEDKSLKKNIGYVNCNNVRKVREMWIKGSNWILATDGGLKDGIGTCSSVMYNVEKGKEMCTSMSAEECNMNLLHSTREELRGILAAETLLDECNLSFGDESQNNVKFVCDNKNAIKAAKGESMSSSKGGMLQPDNEIIMEIKRLQRCNENISREYKWVKSHQNDKILTAEETLNDRADHLATECRENVEQGLIIAESKQSYRGSMATLKINGTVVNKNMKSAIQNALYEEEMRTYLMKKYNWNEETLTLIDWEAMEHCLGSKQGIHKATIFKMIHYWQPTNSYVQRNERRRASAALCPECEVIDKQMHYMICRSEYFEEARGFAWRRFCQSMEKYKRHETLLRIIWIGLQNWVYEDFEEELPKGDDVTKEEHSILVRAFEEQNRIGWKHFVVGRISKVWKKYFALRLPEDIKKGGKVTAFSRTLVYSIWTYTLQVWKRHNEAVHGKKGKYSNRDIESIRNSIQEIYDNLRGEVTIEDQWLFREEVKIRKEKPVPQMLGWLERILLCFDESENENYKKEIICRAKQVLRRTCVCTIY